MIHYRIFKLLDDEDLSNEQFLYEYQLISMSGNETRAQLGLTNSHYRDKILKKLGYHHNRKWNQDDFNMLFERVFLRERIEDLALKYKYSENTVQRRTSELVKLLNFRLTKAPHKKHRKRN